MTARRPLVRANVWGQSIRRALPLALAALLTSFAVGPVTEARADQVDDLFDAGNAAFKAQHYEEAYDKLSQAWKGRHTFDIAANLSIVEHKLNKLRDAAEHLSYALSVFPATGDASRRSRMEADLAEIERGVGKVVIQVPPNTIIQIDGVVIGTSPLPGAVYVEPGTRVIVGEHPTLGSGRAEAACAIGKEVTVMLELKPHGGGGGGGHHSHRSVAPAIIGLGIGAAGLAIGGALIGVHGGQLSDAQALGKTSHCSKSDPKGSCPALDKAASKANTTGNAAIGMFAVGGAGVAVGTGLLIWALTGPNDRGDSDRAASGNHKPVFTPLLSPSFAGGQLDYRF